MVKVLRTGFKSKIQAVRKGECKELLRCYIGVDKEEVRCKLGIS